MERDHVARMWGILKIYYGKAIFISRTMSFVLRCYCEFFLVDNENKIKKI